jgi:ribonucleotide monophosphatase NagD (HAD superfamily)
MDERALVGKEADVCVTSLPSGKDIVFVTNNATKSRRQYKAKFDKLGIQASEVRCLACVSPLRRERRCTRAQAL